MTPKAIGADYRMAKGLTPEVPLRELRARYRRAQRFCDKFGFDAVLVYGSPAEPSWIRYLANYVHPFPIADSFLVVAPGRPPILLVDRDWFLEIAQEMSWVKDVRVYPYVEFEWGYEGLVKIMREIFAPYSRGTIGVCDVDMPAKYYRAMCEALPRAKIKDATPMLLGVLERKSDYDIGMIRKTANIADKVMMAAMNACGPGVPEYKVGLAAEQVAWENGCEFGSGSQNRTVIVVASSNLVLSNVRPYRFTRKPLKKGEMFFIDLSVCFRGYYIDFCRTVCIGRPTQKQRDAYDAVMEIHKSTFKLMRPGVTGEELWDNGLKVARQTGFEKAINFVWLGHGTGLVNSEYPFFAPGEKRALKFKTFANLEPGVFLPGKVGSSSVEDTVFIDKKEAKFVTKCPRDLHIA
ncbi:MAG: M24 family metallopeptidase [Nitrospinota bacterium]